MISEQEITVEIAISRDELLEILKKHNFELKETYRIFDKYMVRSDFLKQNLSDRELIGKCLLIRHIIDENEDIQRIVYKHKEISQNGVILAQSKVNCDVKSVEDAEELLKAIGYQQLFSIDDQMSVYANQTSEMGIQEVNGKHIYIEMETKCSHIDREYADTNELIADFKKYQIPIKNQDFFVKKAEIELAELKKKNSNRFLCF